MRVTLRAIVDPASFRVEAEAESGHRFVLDLPEGERPAEGPSPTTALLGALAACTAADVASILRKKRQTATRYEIGLEADRAEEHPRIFTRIRVEHRVWGEVDPEALRRSVELSATRYCPVNAMLAGRVQIEHRYLLHGPDGSERRETVTSVGPDRD